MQRRVPVALQLLHPSPVLHPFSPAATPCRVPHTGAGSGTGWAAETEAAATCPRSEPELLPSPLLHAPQGALWSRFCPGHKVTLTPLPWILSYKRQVCQIRHHVCVSPQKYLVCRGDPNIWHPNIWLQLQHLEPGSNFVP